MSKELEYIQRQIDIVKQQVKGSKMKIIVTEAVTKHQYDYYENELQTLESIEQALERLEAIDNANPSEAFGLIKRTCELYADSLKQRNLIGYDIIEKQINEALDTIKQALLKAQYHNSTNIFKGSKKVKIEIPESSLMDYNPVKHYLKWEDLEFKEKRQTIKVRIGNTIYDLFFYEFDTGYKRCHLCNEEETLIYDIQEQLFNDLHLERVEE